MLTLDQLPTRLTIIDPPFAAIGWGLSFVTLSLFLLSLYLRWRVPAARWWVFALIALPFAILALGLWGTHTELVLEDNRCELRETRFLVPIKRTIPVASIANAAVGRGRRTNGLVLVLRSGEELPIGIFSDRGGYREAANAINRFLITRR